MPHNGVDHLEVVIPANGIVSLPQKTITEGTCSLTGHISGLAVNGPNMAVELKGPFNVFSPVKDHPFVILASDNGLLVREGH